MKRTIQTLKADLSQDGFTLRHWLLSALALVALAMLCGIAEGL
jgi:hypothetical protein